MPKFAYALIKAVNHHATAVGMHINASKTKVMLALIPGEQRHAVLLDALGGCL